MPFAESQEFYNNFNDYTFEVTVPKNYIVWATGDLMNPREVLQKKYADLLEQSMTSDEVIRIMTQEDRKSTRLNSSHVRISYAVFCLKKKTTNVVYYS